jgi:hypothetical protein
MSSLSVNPQSMPQLSAEEKAHFDQDGWIGTFPLFTVSEVRRACELREQVLPQVMFPGQFAQAEDPLAFERRPWFKSLHTLVPEYYDAARHPAIVGRVASLLGPDFMAWGLTLTRSVPGGAHRWHVDIEHMHWPGVSVYIGRRTTTRIRRSRCWTARSVWRRGPRSSA